MITPPMNRAVGGDAVERGGGTEVDDDRIGPVELDRGEHVHDAVRADGERLVHVERHRQRGPGVHRDAGAAGGRRDPLDDALGDRRRHRRQAHGPHLVGRMPRLDQEAADGAAPLVGRAVGIGGEPPVRLELVAAGTGRR